MYTKFFNGVNYWASHAGIDMWKEWDENVVRQDLEKLSALGMDTLRVFPLWSDFQPLTALLGWGGNLSELSHGERFLDGLTEEDKAGVSEIMMERFEVFCEIAEEYGFKVMVAMITGWMSGRMYFPQAFIGKNIITDPLCVRWEKRFVKYFVNRFKDKKCIVAWELGNECNCLQPLGDMEEANRWTGIIVDAIKSVDPTRPVMSGMHSLTGAGATWNISDQAEHCDVLTVHPYPLFTPDCALDTLISNRAILHSPAENTLYADIGKRPCFVEEIGTLGPTMGNEKTCAAFVRANLLNAWAHDSLGLLWWLGFDCAKNKLSVAPYDWCEVERELGLFDVNGNPKQTAKEFLKFNNFMRGFPYKQMPPRKRQAVCLLNPGNWSAAFGSFMLAKRAGLDLCFANKYEKLEEDKKLYILPSHPGTDFIRYNRFMEVLEKVREGATLLITYDSQMIVPFNEVIGCSSLGRHVAAAAEFEMNGRKMTMPRNYMIELQPETAEVILSDQNGSPLFTKNAYGKGFVLFLNAPLESWFASQPAIASVDCGYEMIYAYAKECAKISECVEKQNPLSVMTMHEVDERTTIVIALNNTDKEIEEKFTFKGVRLHTIYNGNMDLETYECVIPSADAVIFEVVKK